MNYFFTLDLGKARQNEIEVSRLELWLSNLQEIGNLGKCHCYS